MAMAIYIVAGVARRRGMRMVENIIY